MVKEKIQEEKKSNKGNVNLLIWFKFINYGTIIIIVLPRKFRGNQIFQ